LVAARAFLGGRRERNTGVVEVDRLKPVEGKDGRNVMLLASSSFKRCAVVETGKGQTVEYVNDVFCAS
jgi:hypothetical protein